MGAYDSDMGELEQMRFRLEALEAFVQELGFHWCDNCGWVKATKTKYKKPICDKCERRVI